MPSDYYPWGGNFITADPHGCVAVVLLSIDYIPPAVVAIYGTLRTENIGIEKIVANIISNPFIRYLVICGKEIRGHQSGASLLALHKYGIDNSHRIIHAPGAIPYIENIDTNAIKRFQDQIQIVDLLNITDQKTIDNTIYSYHHQNPGSYGKPYIAIQITPKQTLTINDKRAIHSKIVIDYLGRIHKRGT